MDASTVKNLKQWSTTYHRLHVGGASRKRDPAATDLDILLQMQMKSGPAESDVQMLGPRGGDRRFSGRMVEG